MDWKKALFKEGSPSASDKPLIKSVPEGSVRSDAASESPPPQRTSYLGDPSRPRSRSAQVSSGQEAAGFETPDPQFDAELKAALARATSSGYDALVAQIEVLQDVVPDEGRRMEKALQSVNRMLRLTPDQIVSSVRERISVLEQERSQFETGISAEVEDKVAESQSNLRSLQDSLDQNETEQKRLEEQIRRLKGEQERLIAERSNVQGEVKAINAKADAVRAKFKSAYHANLNPLKMLLDKIRPSGN